jgi:hypothetical protein
MGFRFQRRINLGGGVRLNLSKSGVGMSVGTKGLRVGTGPRGNYTSVGIPSTGLSYRSVSSRNAIPRASVRAGFATSGVFELLNLLPLLFWGVIALVLLCALIAAILFAAWSLIIPLGIGAGTLWGVVFGYRRWVRSENPIYSFRQSSNRLSQHIANKDWKSALRALDECELIANQLDQRIKAGVDLYTVLGMKGLALHQLGRYEEAIPWLQRTVTRNSNPSSVNTERVMLANAYRQTKRYKDAIEVLLVPVAESMDIQAKVIRADCHLELGQVGAAISILKSTPITKKNLDTNLQGVHYLLAKAYERRGERKQALAELLLVHAADATFMDVAEEISRLESNP